MDALIVDRLLARAVDAEGRVRYGSLQAADVRTAVEEIAAASLDGVDAKARYAFLLNAYNVCALDLATRLLWKKRSSLRHPLRWLRFFVFSPVRVAGRRMNLAWLEHVVLRRHLRRDPRGHFALVCASQGCPPLKDGRYHGEALDDELDAAARSFMQPGGGYTTDRQRNVLWVNRILKWYQRDFRSLGGARGVVVRYGAADDAAWIQENRPRVRFLPYSWSLNVADPA